MDIRIATHGVLLSAAVICTACSGPGADAPKDTSVSTGTTVTQSLSPHESTEQSALEGSAVTSIRITIGGREISGQLGENPAARELAEYLPLALTFRDLNGVEKIARLPQPVTTDGVPDGADPDVADIGYYAPTQDLVLYYGDVGYWEGIVQIGSFDTSRTELIASRSDGFEATIEAVTE